MEWLKILTEPDQFYTPEPLSIVSNDFMPETSGYFS